MPAQHYGVNCAESPNRVSYTVTRARLSQTQSALRTLAAVAFAALCYHLDVPRREAIAIFALVLLSYHSQLEESLTVLPGLGIQLTRTRNRFLGAPYGTGVPLGSHAISNEFVPLERIKNVVINEGIDRTAGFRYYLAVVKFVSHDVVDDDARVETIVAFPGTLPRIKDLIPILKRIRSSLVLSNDGVQL